jgi:signal transduction histidine kinase
MKSSRRTLIAVAITVAAAVIGMTAWTLDRVDPGMTFGTGTDAQGRMTLTVGSVTPGGLAWYEGVHAGDVVINVGGIQTLPGDQAVVEAYANSQESQSALIIVPPDQLKGALADGGWGSPPARLAYFIWAPRRLTASGIALLAGFLLCLMGFLWHRSASPGPSLSRMLPTVLAASATPLFLVPAYLTLSSAAVLLASVLIAAAVLLAGLDMTRAIGPTRVLRAVVLVTGLAALAAAIVGCVIAFTGFERGLATEARWVFASAAVLIPGLVAVRYLRAPGVASELGRTIDSIEVGVAATLPAFALMPLAAVTDPPFLTPLVAWVLVVVALRVFAIRPMARLATQTTIERELIVDDSEAERRRIAGDIHDDVIQDLTMLVHRLDRDGADEQASTVRRAVERLRAICADLRLPVLDDLGLGPAVHALVTELEPLAGGDISLDIDGENRLPADVELTVFRIAQETLANAVKHGRPPISVHLDIHAENVRLQINDSGPGIPVAVLTAPPAEGHMGLLSLTQRAQQIGASLEIGERPGGGTRVRLDWAANARPAESAINRQPAN